MRSLLFTCLLLCSSFAVVVAQPASKALLYKISGNGLSSPSYLLGTFHLLCEEDLPKDSLIYQSLRATRSICLELDLTDPKKMASVMRYMMHTDTPSWQSMIAADTLIILDSIFKANTKMSLRQLKTLKPFAVTTMMFPSLLGCPAKNMETVLAAEAKKHGLTIQELETVERQFKAIGAAPLSKQVADLQTAMLKMDSTRSTFKTMVDMYRNRDLPGIQKMFETQEREGNTDMEALLSSRNREWIPLMTVMMKKEPVFFAVGAGHLPGIEGVITLLTNKGYSISPVW